MSGVTPARRVSVRRMEAARATLADLTTQDHDELTGEVRDAIGLVRHVLADIAERIEVAPDGARMRRDVSKFQAGDRLQMPGIPMVVTVLDVLPGCGDEGCDRETFTFEDPAGQGIDSMHADEFELASRRPGASS